MRLVVFPFPCLKIHLSIQDLWSSTLECQQPQSLWHPRTKLPLFLYILDFYLDLLRANSLYCYLQAGSFISLTPDSKVTLHCPGNRPLAGPNTHRGRKSMAAPNQPNTIPPIQSDHVDIVPDLCRMIIAVKDIDRDNRTCPICSDPYADRYTDQSPDGEKTPMRLPCGHIFDLGCLLNWLLIDSDGHIRNTCPMCRTPLFHQIRPEQKADVRHLRRVLVPTQIDDQQRLEEEDGPSMPSRVLTALLWIIFRVVILPIAVLVVFKIGDSIVRFVMDSFDIDRQHGFRIE